MTWLSDAAIDRLRRAADWPDLGDLRYRVIDLIGRGGMGAVYLAEDRELDRQVAVKVLSVAGPVGDLHERLRQEARILGRLEHPGIVPVHDVGTLADGRLYYVMKRVRGTRLDEHVRAERPLTERLRIFERICETVAFAHAHGVVHRDLKPENVMVGEFGEVLVLDWGVAKVIGAASGPEVRTLGRPAGDRGPDTGHGTVLGTPGYMAPEQARGEANSVDERADVFALGAILGFLLTRNPPRGAPAEAGSVTPVPRPLRAVREKAQAEDPAGRYQSVQALAADVARFRDGRAVGAYPENVLERLGRVGRTYRVAILLVVAYLLMRVLLLMIGT